jgi:hypothetical protein
LNRFINGGEQKHIDLSELILQKIREKEAEQGSTYKSQTVEDVKEKLHPKVVAAYKKYVNFEVYPYMY